MSRRRFAHPLRAIEPSRAGDGSLYLLMLNNSGGMVGGDRLRTTVHLGAGASVVLATASATKAYRTAGAPAIHETLVQLDRDATIEYLPDHLIPHPGAAAHQSFRLEMAPGSRAIVHEAIAGGRIGRGERWAFRELRTETTLIRDARLLYINRLKIIPELQPLTQIGLAQDFNYLASIVIVGETASDGTAYVWPELGADLGSVLCKCAGVYGAVSEIARGGIVVRFMAYRASDLSLATHALWGAARRFLVGLDAFEWRKY